MLLSQSMKMKVQQGHSVEHAFKEEVRENRTGLTNFLQAIMPSPPEAKRRHKGTHKRAQNRG